MSSLRLWNPPKLPTPNSPGSPAFKMYWIFNHFSPSMGPGLTPVTSGRLENRRGGSAVKSARCSYRRPKFGSQHPQQVTHSHEKNSSSRDSKHPLLASMFTQTHIHTCVNKVFLKCTGTLQYPRTLPQPRLLLPASSSLYLTAYLLDGAVSQARHTQTSWLHADCSPCLDALLQTCAHPPSLLLSNMCYQDFSHPSEYDWLLYQLKHKTERG